MLVIQKGVGTPTTIKPNYSKPKNPTTNMGRRFTAVSLPAVVNMISYFCLTHSSIFITMAFSLSLSSIMNPQSSRGGARFLSSSTATFISSAAVTLATDYSDSSCTASGSDDQNPCYIEK